MSKLSQAMRICFCMSYDTYRKIIFPERLHYSTDNYAEGKFKKFTSNPALGICELDSDKVKKLEEYIESCTQTSN